MLLILLFVVSLRGAAPWSNYLSGKNSSSPPFDRVIQRIVTDEANKIGRAADEHAAYCIVRLPWQLRFLVTEEEEQAVANELSSLASVRGMEHNLTSDQVMPFLSKLIPNTYSVWKKIENHIREKAIEMNFGNDSLEHFGRVGNAALDSLAFASALPRGLSKQRRDELFEDQVKILIKRSMKYYKCLTDAGRDDLERLLCPRTFYRVLDAFEQLGPFREFMGVFKDTVREFEDLINVA